MYGSGRGFVNTFSLHFRLHNLNDLQYLGAKPKADRLSWIYKMFSADVESLPVQEHMEMGT